LIRTAAIRQAGLVRHDEVRALCEIMVWLAKIVRWGNFRRVPQPLYYRLDHPENYHKEWFGWPEARQRAAWTTMFTGLLEAAMPLCRTPEERLFLQQVILDRVVVFRPARNYLYCPTNEPHSSGELIAECLERLKFEGNMHLLGLEELPRGLLQASFRSCGLSDQLLEALERLSASERQRIRLETELTGLKRSRMLKLGRLIRRLVGAPLNIDGK
jgi:hypothetical protein